MSTTGDARPGPLAGTRVVEITRYVQGPVAGLMLAALGADVIKIELVGRADSMRSGVQIHGVPLGDRGRDWLYASVNRGKRALALDVTSESGKPIFHQLITRSDVFLTNLRDRGPGGDRGGRGDAAGTERRPGLRAGRRPRPAGTARR